jgi:Asp/Glu/hydantoin racemase
MQGALMSSMLDDTFFVLRQSANRALSTSSLSCFVSTLSVIIEQLRSTFKETLARKLSGCTAAIISCFQDDQVPAAAEVEVAAAPLNNVVQSTTFIAKMHEALEAQAVQRHALLLP